jgi:hypothetical protein
MKDKSEALWLNDYFIPIKKYQEYQLASWACTTDWVKIQNGSTFTQTL